MTIAPATFRVAEPERRFRAFVVDRAIAWTTFALAGLAAWWWLFRDGKIGAGIGLIVGVVLLVSLVFIIMVGRFGLSPGRALFGLRVVNVETGDPIGFGPALLRTTIIGAGSLPMFGLGTATLAWTAVEDRTGERRGWHDHIAKSVVVDVRPVLVHEQQDDDRPRHVVNLTAMRLMPVKQPEVPVVPAPTGQPNQPSQPGPASQPGSFARPGQPAKPLQNLQIGPPPETSEPSPPSPDPHARRRRIDPVIRQTPFDAPSRSEAAQPAPAPRETPAPPTPPTPAVGPGQSSRDVGAQPDGSPSSPQPSAGQPMGGPVSPQAPAARSPWAPPAEGSQPAPTQPPPAPVSPPQASPTPPGPTPPSPSSGPTTQIRPSSGRHAGPAQRPTGPPPKWRVQFDSGETFVVEGLGLVGRKPEGRQGEPVRHVVPLRSEDMSISKTHAQFHLAGDGALVVMDRGSTNGSLLLRRGVTRELSAGRPTTLVDGDLVRFGDREMRVVREAP